MSLMASPAPLETGTQGLPGWSSRRCRLCRRWPLGRALVAVPDWMETAPDAKGDARSFRVINWSGGFAALGAGHPPAGLTFWTSVDGITWRSRALPIHGAEGAYLQAFGSGILLT